MAVFLQKQLVIALDYKTEIEAKIDVIKNCR